MSAKRRSSRREFLAGKSAVDALGDIGAGEAAGSDRPRGASAREAAYLLHVGREAMACQFQVYLNAGQHPGAVEAAVEAMDLVEQMEDQLTVYRSHSELMEINRLAAKKPVTVEPRLFHLLQTAQRLNRDTAGAFDITSSPLSRLWGFARREGRFADAAEIEATLPLVDARLLRLDPQQRTIRFAKDGVEINVNGIGKGYALDRCRELLEEYGVRDFVIHGGHSSVLASGHRAGGSDADGWVVSLQHPLWQNRPLAEIRLRDQALGTSGAANQFFYHEGRRYGHVLDPRTGYPAEGVLSATVLAPTAAEADALATAFYVLGADAARRYCAEHAGIAALLVCPGQRAGAIELVPIELAHDQWTRADDESSKGERPA